MGGGCTQLHRSGGVAGREARMVNYNQIREGSGERALKIWFGMQVSIAIELAHTFK